MNKKSVDDHIFLSKTDIYIFFLLQTTTTSIELNVSIIWYLFSGKKKERNIIRQIDWLNDLIWIFFCWKWKQWWWQWQKTFGQYNFIAIQTYKWTSVKDWNYHINLFNVWIYIIFVILFTAVAAAAAGHHYYVLCIVEW